MKRVCLAMGLLACGLARSAWAEEPAVSEQKQKQLIEMRWFARATKN